MNQARARGARIALGLSVLATACPGLMAHLGARPSTVAVCIALAFVPYAALIAESGPLDAATATRLALMGAVCAGGLLLPAPPVLSDDVYRYLWDGRVLRQGIDPYAYPPSHPELAALRDVLWQRVNHRDVATIYPPLAELMFALCDAVAHHPYTFKTMALAAHLATTWAVAAISRTPQAPLVYGLNPLALSESALHGHVDALAGCGLAFAVLALRRGTCASARRTGPSPAQRPPEKRTLAPALLAALSLAVATGTKLVGLLLLPFTRRLGARAAMLAFGLSALVLVPLLAHAGDERAGVSEYARRWRGNGALFPVLERGVVYALGHAASDDDLARNHIRIPALAPYLEWVRGSALDPWRGAVAAHKSIPDPTDFELPFLAGLIARTVVLAVCLLLPWVLAARRVEPLQGARVTLFSGLLLAPQIHPWYLLWLLPLEASAGRWSAIVWSSTVLVAYAPIDLWQRARIWNEGSLANACEFGIVALVLLCDARVFKKGRHDHAGLSAVQNRPRAQ